MRTLAGFLFLTLLLANTGQAQESKDGRISGVVFADYYYNVVRDTGFSALANTALGGKKDLNGFRLRRLYFTYDKPLTASFAMRFRMEVDESAKTANGKIGAFVKDAYLKWKNIFAGSDLTVGIQPSLGFEVSEKLWGYRSIEKTIMDLRGVLSSRDQGISLKGSLSEEGMFSYKVMYSNNSANKPEADKYKKVAVRLEAVPVKNLRVTVYGDLAVRSPLTTPTGTLGNNAMTYAGFVGYKKKGSFAIGLEGFMQSFDNGFVQAGSYSTRSALGVSAFGSYMLSASLSVLARLDTYDANTNSAANGDSRTYGIVGLDWRPEGNVSIIPNILVESYENVSGAASIDPSITARVTFTFTY